MELDLNLPIDQPVHQKPQQLLKKGITHVHEAFANYMLINPGCRLREMGAHFGYTVPWICTVINSDMFKAYFAERRGEIRVHIMEDLPSRLAAAGALATERIIEVLETTNDNDTIIDSFDKVMHRLGYAPNTNKAGTAPGQTNIQNNNFFLGKADLAEARQAMITAHTQPVEVFDAIPAPAAAPT